MEETPIKLRLLRRDKRLSQDEVARQLGVSRQTIFSIETGRSEPSLSLALKICSLFDAAIEEVFADAFSPELPNQNQRIDNERKEVTLMSPNIIPFSPFSELTNLHREIDRFFEDSLTSPKNTATVAAMNVRDTGDDFKVEVAVPGFTQEEIDIEAGQDFLTIKGEKKVDNKTEDKGFLKREFNYSQFERSIVLPSDIQTDKVDASIEHGTLMITLPKVQPTEPKVAKIQVKAK